MNNRWTLIILLIIFSIVAGAALVIANALSPKDNPYVRNFETCHHSGGKVSSVSDRDVCTYMNEKYYK